MTLSVKKLRRGLLLGPSEDFEVNTEVHVAPSKTPALKKPEAIFLSPTCITDVEGEGQAAIMAATAEGNERHLQHVIISAGGTLHQLVPFDRAAAGSPHVRIGLCNPGRMVPISEVATATGVLRAGLAGLDGTLAAENLVSQDGFYWMPLANEQNVALCFLIWALRARFGDLKVYAALGGSFAGAYLFD